MFLDYFLSISICEKAGIFSRLFQLTEQEKLAAEFDFYLHAYSNSSGTLHDQDHATFSDGRKVALNLRRSTSMYRVQRVIKYRGTVLLYLFKIRCAISELRQTRLKMLFSLKTMSKIDMVDSCFTQWTNANYKEPLELPIKTKKDEKRDKTTTRQ